MKRMLINATQPEELRVAMVDGQYLYDLDIEVASHSQKKASVFKGKVTRVEPSLEAAFVDYGAERHGFLPFKEIARDYFADADAEGKVSVKNALKEGQELIVQVEKEERGNKGAALTTFPSLAGRYLVLMPNNPRAGGISRRVEGDDRTELREALSELEVPTGMGLIVRTAGVGKSAEELQWDLDYLLKVWNAIDLASKERVAPFLVYQESNVIIRAIRDYFRQDISEILIDGEEVHQQAHDFIAQVMPANLNKLKLYDNAVPLFSRFQIESQIESAFNHTVQLPSGGSIVIDHTEALISVDVNSARATKGADIEETALNTNLEAADEVARQLRLRDVGGLIVIDFIDMTPARNQRDVENRFRDALKPDRARVQIGRISRFGLLEMSRQRLRPSLGESSLKVCPVCTGQGQVRNPESLALSILRLMEEESIKDQTSKVVISLPIEVGTYLLNEKREAIADIEQRHGVRSVLIPDAALQSPTFRLERIRVNDTEHLSNFKASYEMATDKVALPDFVNADPGAAREEPAVKTITPPAPVAAAPPPPTPARDGILRRAWVALFGIAEPPAHKPAARPTSDRNSGGGRGRGSRGERGNSDRQGSADGEQRKNSQRRGAEGRNSRRSQNNRTDSEVRQRHNTEGGSAPESRQDDRSAAPNNANQPPAAVEPVAPETGDNSTQASGSSRSGRSGSRRGRRGGQRNRARDADGASPQNNSESSSSGQSDGASDSRGADGTTSAATDPDAVTEVRNPSPDNQASAPEGQGNERRGRRRGSGRGRGRGNSERSETPNDGAATAGNGQGHAQSANTPGGGSDNPEPTPGNAPHHSGNATAPSPPAPALAPIAASPVTDRAPASAEPARTLNPASVESTNSEKASGSSAGSGTKRGAKPEGGSAVPNSSDSAAPSSGGNTAPSSGGSPAPSSGGNTAPSSGGSPAPSSGGTAAPSSGGSPAASSGGNTASGSGGNTAPASSASSTSDSRQDTKRATPTEKITSGD